MSLRNHTMERETRTDGMSAPDKETTPVYGAVMTRERVTSESASPSDPAAANRTEIAAPRASIGLIVGSFFALLLSAWAALVLFVGPTFGFAPDGALSWTWSEGHALGGLLPGAVGVVASLIILVGAPRPMGLQSTAVLSTAGFTLLLCGIWLTLVPLLWPIWVGTYFLSASPTMTLAYYLAATSGPGILLIAFGSFAIGRARSASTMKQLQLQ